MKITFMLFYFDPENPTINYLYRPLWDKLISLGHSINIVTPNPTRGINPQEQLNYHKSMVEEKDSFTIYRVKCYTYKPQAFSKFNLFRRYVSVSFRLARKLRHIDSDIVFVSSNPPLLYSYLITKYCRRKKIPVIYNVQDIYPDNVFDKKSLAYKFFDIFQKKSLERATEVVTISETMRHTLLEKGDYNDKINVIYNFDISDVLNNEHYGTTFFEESKFNVVYAGNIGYVQDLDVILSAAKLLMHDPAICIHIFGEGSQANRIAARIRDENIVNTTYYPAISVEESAGLYKKADVNLISILPGIIKTALPLKTASCIAAGKPIIFVGLETFYHNEAWVESVKELYPVNFRNYEKLADIILALSKKGKKDINHQVIDLFDKERTIDKYVELILRHTKK